ncbi:MAG: hypothetical protein ACI8PZ_002014 [Myxococcota bacterium]|jgi:hypothetical protein
MRQLIPFILLTACGPETGAKSGGVGCGPDVERALDVGACAPDFTLPDRAGLAFTLSHQRGKVALVDVSALW